MPAVSGQIRQAIANLFSDRGNASMLMFNSILVITRPKRGGIGTHWGVQFPDGHVADYTQEVGLRFTTKEGFSEGLPVTIVREIPGHMALSVRARLDAV